MGNNANRQYFISFALFGHHGHDIISQTRFISKIDAEIHFTGLLVNTQKSKNVPYKIARSNDRIAVISSEFAILLDTKRTKGMNVVSEIQQIISTYS